MKDTKIEWCDSSLNIMMGCDGCELWNPKAGVVTCYAGATTERYGGQKGWPVSFAQPAIFLERLKPALDWPDLRGKERPDKPWLNGFARTIFLDDMGDTFTESLPLDWLASSIPEMKQSPHIFQLLTKRPKRMKAFFDQLGHVPANFWLMTTVTSQATVQRVYDLSLIEGASVYGVSYEPMWGAFDCSFLSIPLNWWMVAGGESGPKAKPFHGHWPRAMRDTCARVGAPFFWKQVGEWAWRENQVLRRVNEETGHVSNYEEHRWDDGSKSFRIGKRKAGRLLDGVEHNEMPEVPQCR